MTEHQAQRLQVGDEVRTYLLPPGETHIGRIVDTGYDALTVKWDDGQVGIFLFDDTDRLARLEFFRRM